MPAFYYYLNKYMQLFDMEIVIFIFLQDQKLHQIKNKNLIFS